MLLVLMVSSVFFLFKFQHVQFSSIKKKQKQTFFYFLIRTHIVIFFPGKNPDNIVFHDIFKNIWTVAGPCDNNFHYMRTMGLDLHNNKGMWTRFWSEFLKAVAHFNKLCTEAGNLYMAGHTDLHQYSGPVWWLSNLTKWCFNEAGSKGHRCCSHSRSLLKKKRTPGTEYMNAITTCYSLLTENITALSSSVCCICITY